MNYSNFLNKKWSQEYNCFNFFCDIQKDLFGVNVSFNPNLTTSEGFNYFLGHQELYSNWDRVEEPQEGDAVIFGCDQSRFHIGVMAMIDGKLGVLHNDEKNGVIFTKSMAMKLSGVNIYGYYRFKK